MANMMEFVDNKYLMKVVELCIDRATDIFDASTNFTSELILKDLQARAKKEPPKQGGASVSQNLTVSREAFFADMSAHAPDTLAASRGSAG